MCRYINELSQEKTFILFQGEEITLEAEQAYLESQLEKIANRSMVQLLAVAGHQIIANTGIQPNESSEKHISSFVIAVTDDYRGI